MPLFAFFVWWQWGNEIVVEGRKEENLTHADYLYFAIEGVSTVGYGDATASRSLTGYWTLSLGYILSILFRPVSELVIYELVCYLIRFYHENHREIVVDQIGDGGIVNDNLEENNTETHTD
jgi:hypothetical protein